MKKIPTYIIKDGVYAESELTAEFNRVLTHIKEFMDENGYPPHLEVIRLKVISDKICDIHFQDR